MKQILCILSALLLTTIGYAQYSDDIIQAKALDGELKEKGQVSSDVRYRMSVPVQMAAGDQLLIECKSTEFVLGIGISDATGFQTRKEDDPMFFKSIGSKLTIPFNCKKSGAYNIVIYAKQEDAKGHFNAKIFYYNSGANKVSSSSSFCDRLKFIIANSPSGYQFINAGSAGFMYKPSFYLFPGTYSTIFTNTGGQYLCTVANTTDQGSLNRKFDELESNLASCLVGHKKNIYTSETVNESEKKDFIRRVEFYLPGTNPVDINSGHINNIVDLIVLRLDKDGADKFKLRIEVH